MRKSIAVVAALIAPLGGVLAGTADAAPHLQSVTLYYDASDAPDYVAQIDEAAANWNGLTTNVKLQSGGAATIVIHETDDGQGSYTQTDGHGHGDIYIDKQQVEEGFNPVRIAAHELGHNMGLPDDYTGPCSEIMSGHGPGTSCTNAIPDATEVAQVDDNFANGLVAAVVRHKVA
jgi:snapalysin